MDKVTLSEAGMSNNFINNKKKQIDTINIFLKLSTPLKNRVPIILTKKIDDYFKLKKETLVFDVLQSLKLQRGEGASLTTKRKEINARDVIWTAWFQGRENLPPLIYKCIDSFTKISNRQIVIIDKHNYCDYIQLPALIIEKFNEGLISYTAFSEIIRISLLAEYGGLWLDATIFVDRDVSFLIKDKKYVSLRSHKDLNNGNLMGAFPVYFLYSDGYSEGLDDISFYLLTYWQCFNVQVDYFLVDYIFKFVYFNNKSFKQDTDANPLLGKKRFLLNDIMNKPYNKSDSEKLKNNQVPVYKLSNKLKYNEFDSSGKETFFKRFIRNESLY